MHQKRIENEWTDALADAGFAPTDICLVGLDSARGKNDRLSIYYPPREVVYPGAELDKDALDYANAPGCVELHRVVVWHDELDVAILAGRMRHELEHARQWDELGEDLFVLDRFLDEIIIAKVGNAGGPGGAGSYYNFKPVEQDANAAASMYLRELYPDRLDSVRADEEGTSLVRSLKPPEAMSTLFSRSIAFLFQFRDVVENVVAPQTPLDRVEVMWPDYAELWKTLESA